MYDHRQGVQYIDVGVAIHIDGKNVPWRIFLFSTDNVLSESKSASDVPGASDAPGAPDATADAAAPDPEPLALLEMSPRGPLYAPAHR